MKKHLLMFVALAFTFVLTGCGNSVVPEKYSALLSDKSGKYVKLGFYGMPDQINPIKAPEFSHDKMLSNLVFASPLRKLENGEYAPYLFENFETSIDGEQVVLKATWRQGLKWHDGKAFEPADFDFSISQMKLPENNSPYSVSANGIVSMTNTDNKFEIRFAENSVKYMDMLCAGLLPAHILDENNLASGTKAVEIIKKYWEKPIGLGPYKIVDNTKSRYFELEPVADYFDGKGASRPKLVIVCSHELQQTISDFREGVFDWIDIPSLVGEQLQNLGIENVVYNHYPNPAVMAWVFNTKNEKLQDVRIRKALNLILDRGCAKQYMGGESIEFFDNLLPVDSKDKNQNAMEEGLKLLTEAGVVDSNNDGIREYKGSDFRLSILINEDNMTRRLIAEKMIENLKKFGVEAVIETVNWHDFMNNRLKAENFDTALLSYHIADDYSFKSLFYTKNADNADSLNFTGISDFELDADLKALDSIIANEDKAVIAMRVNKRISQLCPCAFLLRPVSLALLHGNGIKTECSKSAFWNDMYNWKLMFGNESSKF